MKIVKKYLTAKASCLTLGSLLLMGVLGTMGIGPMVILVFHAMVLIFLNNRLKNLIDILDITVYFFAPLSFIYYQGDAILKNKNQALTPHLFCDIIVL